jgi:hypothetical protein
LSLRRLVLLRLLWRWTWTLWRLATVWLTGLLRWRRRLALLRLTAALWAWRLLRTLLGRLGLSLGWLALLGLLLRCR